MQIKLNKIGILQISEAVQEGDAFIPDELVEGWADGRPSVYTQEVQA